jgi:hypothetical protein
VTSRQGQCSQILGPRAGFEPSDARGANPGVAAHPGVRVHALVTRVIWRWVGSAAAVATNVKSLGRWDHRSARDAMMAALGATAGAARPLGKVAVRGCTEPVPIWGLD